MFFFYKNNMITEIPNFISKQSVTKFINTFIFHYKHYFVKISSVTVIIDHGSKIAKLDNMTVTCLNVRIFLRALDTMYVMFILITILTVV